MISSVASIAGPFLGGIIYAIIEFRVFLLITGVSFILSGVSEIFIDFELNNRYFKKDEEEDIQESVKVETNILGDIKEGLSYMVSQKWLMSIGVFVIFLNLFICSSSLYCKRSMGIFCGTIWVIKYHVSSRNVTGFFNTGYITTGQKSI